MYSIAFATAESISALVARRRTLPHSSSKVGNQKQSQKRPKRDDRDPRRKAQKVAVMTQGTKFVRLI
jgi:hypothetical protein